MRHAAAAAIALGVLFIVSGCDHSKPCSENPSGPSCPPLTVTITSFAEHLENHETSTFTATARHPDGSTATVTEWSSDASGVATVDPASGVVTAVAPGHAAIIARHDGAAASKQLHVLAVFGGGWQGHYQVTRCGDTGDFRKIGFCDEFPINESLPLGLSLDQTGEATSGTMALGQLEADVDGSIDEAGQLSLLDTTMEFEGMTIRVKSIKLTENTEDRLQGTFTTEWTFPNATGYGRFDAKLATVRRVSPTAGPMWVGSARPRTWSEIVRALKSW